MLREPRKISGRCAVCGGQSDQAFTITTAAGHVFTFDSFECAIDRLSPRCAHCGIRIMGHGTPNQGSLFCGAHCAHYQGIDAFA